MSVLPDWNDLPETVRDAICGMPAAELSGSVIYQLLRGTLVVAGAGDTTLAWQADGDEFVAPSEAGRFHILPLGGVFMIFVDGTGHGGRYGTLDEAKAEAQREYQRRAIDKAIAACRTKPVEAAVGYISEWDLDHLATRTAGEQPFIVAEIRRAPAGKANIALYRAPAGVLDACVHAAMEETYLVEDDPDESDHDQKVRVRTAKRIISRLRALGSATPPALTLTKAQLSTLREMASYAPHAYVFRHATCAELVALGLAIAVQPAHGRKLKRPPHRMTELGLEVFNRSKR